MIVLSPSHSRQFVSYSGLFIPDCLGSLKDGPISPKRPHTREPCNLSERLKEPGAHLIIGGLQACSLVQKVWKYINKTNKTLFQEFLNLFIF